MQKGDRNSHSGWESSTPDETRAQLVRLERNSGISFANIAFRDPKDIFDSIEKLDPGKDRRVQIPSFFLADKQIYSFEPFNSGNPLTVCIGEKNPPVATKEWFDDETKHQKLVMLLNFNLKDLCR